MQERTVRQTLYTWMRIASDTQTKSSDWTKWYCALCCYMISHLFSDQTPFQMILWVVNMSFGYLFDLFDSLFSWWLIDWLIDQLIDWLTGVGCCWMPGTMCTCTGKEFYAHHLSHTIPATFPRSLVTWPTTVCRKSCQKTSASMKKEMKCSLMSLTGKILS